MKPLIPREVMCDSEHSDIMNPLQNFDYRVPCDDFLLYELGRLIEEDKASFDEAEFRNVIDAGISEHVERKLDIRAAIAMRLRTAFRRPRRDVSCTPLKISKPRFETFLK